MVQCSSFKSGLRLVLLVLIVIRGVETGRNNTQSLCFPLSLPPSTVSLAHAFRQESQWPHSTWQAHNLTHMYTEFDYITAQIPGFKKFYTEGSENVVAASVCPSEARRDDHAERLSCPCAEGLRNVSLPLNCSSRDSEDKDTHDTRVVR